MRRMRLFILLIAAFYAWYVWYMTGGERWSIFADQWPIALTMLAGSGCAGATPVGGGAVAFPVLTLVFDQPASLGREFSFAIQSVGMTAAAVYVLCARRPVAWRFLRWALAGALMVTPAGVLVVAPAADDGALRLGFAGLWLVFGAVALSRLQRVSAEAGRDEREPGPAMSLGVGAASAFVGSILGSGADMITFSYLVLARGMDPRRAIPTGMMLMAVTSIAGLAAMLGRGDSLARIEAAWLAAAPVVVLGAPLGAALVSVIPRRITMCFVALLCVAQFTWAVWKQQPEWWITTAIVAAALGAAAWAAGDPPAVARAAR